MEKNVESLSETPKAATRYLRAYYFSFDGTGVDEIDAILEALCDAGSGYHHTESWADRDYNEPSHIDKIAEAAKVAAAKLNAAEQDNKRLREALEWYEHRAARCRKITSDGDDARRELDADGGNRARAALKTGEQALCTFNVPDQGEPDQSPIGQNRARVPKES